MVRLKYKGFVSNIYVWFKTVQFLLFVAFFSGLIWMVDPFQIALLAFPILCVVFMLIHYMRTPIPYKIVSLDADGVKCGKEKIRYEDITQIHISDAYISERFGSVLLENALGISQHIEMYVENMICINCEFQGLKGKRANQCIYIPKNAKTDSILRRFSSTYTAIADKMTGVEKREYNPFGKKKINVFCTVACNVFWCALLVLLAENGFLEYYKVGIVLPIGMILTTISGLQEEIFFLLHKSANGRKS